MMATVRLFDALPDFATQRPRIAADNPCLAYGLSFEVRPIEGVRASAFAVTSETPAAATAPTTR